MARDAGELIHETTEYGTWADWLGVPRHTFSAMFGAIITRRADYRQSFQHSGLGSTWRSSGSAATRRTSPEHFDEHDLYPDVRPCLEKLRQLGFRDGVAGNQTAQAERPLRALDLPADFIGTSDGREAEKPSAGFFDRIIAECGCAPGEIAYVGDRLDNDIRPDLPRGWSPRSCGAARGAISTPHIPTSPRRTSASSHSTSCPNAWH